MALSFWKTFSPKLKRILLIIFFFFLSLIVTIAGVLTPLSHDEAISINQEFEQALPDITLQYIFGNNFMICLIMFVPFAGPVFGFYALYNTGVIIAASSIAQYQSPIINFLFLVILPVFWLEFLAYSTAMSESVWLIWRAIQHKGKKELMNACILISFCACLLYTSDAADE